MDSNGSGARRGSDGGSKSERRRENMLRSVYRTVYPIGFNPYAFPARLALAEDHRQATQFGKRVWLPNSTRLCQRVCKCCKNFIDTRQFCFWAGFRDVGTASPSYAMYFYLILFGIVILFFNFALTGIATLVMLPKARDIFLTSPIDWDEASPTPNYDGQFAAATRVRGALGFINVIALLCAKYAIFAFIAMEFNALEDIRLTASAFALRVHTPRDRNEQQIAAELSAIGTGQLEVIKVNKVYDISRYAKELRRLLLAQKRVKILSAKNWRETLEYRWAHSRLKSALARFDAVRGSFKTAELLAERYTGIAFVTFASSTQRQQLEARFHSWFSGSRHLSGYSARRAPEPADVIWENYGLSRAQKITRRLFTYAVSLFVVAVNFAIIIVLKVLQFKLLRDYPLSLFATLGLSMLVSMVIALLNLIGLVVLIALTQFERRTLHSSIASNKVVKVFHTLFVTSAVNILVSTILANTFVVSWNRREIIPSWGIWVDGGVVNSAAAMMLVSTLTSFLPTFIDPNFLYRLYRRVQLGKMARKDPRGNRILQCELNEAFEKHEYDLAGQYINLFRVLAVSFFYQPLLPYGLLLGMAELFIHFITQRYFIFHQTLRPREFDARFTFQLSFIFHVCIICLATGYVVFDAIINGRVNAFCWAAFTIAVLDGFIGAPLFAQKVLNRRPQIQGQEYVTAKAMLSTDYDRLNPLTQRAAVEQWLKEIRETGSETSVLAPAAPRAPPALTFDVGINEYLYSETGFGQGSRNLYSDMAVEANDPSIELNVLTSYNAQKLISESRRAQNIRRLHSNGFSGEDSISSQNDISILVSQMLTGRDEGSSIIPDALLSPLHGRRLELSPLVEEAEDECQSEKCPPASEPRTDAAPEESYLLLKGGEQLPKTTTNRPIAQIPRISFRDILPFNVSEQKNENILNKRY